MNRNCFKVLLSAGLLLCTLAAGGRTTYTNPVIAHDCPDPTVLDDRASIPPRASCREAEA